MSQFQQQPKLAFATDRIKLLKQNLRQHPIYERLTSWDEVRQFMEVHVYAVWDFMSLLKSLQQEICGCELPWTPPRDPLAARLINQIVLDEESDLAPDGSYKSHFQLYLEAMEQMQCSRRGIQALLLRISELSRTRQTALANQGAVGPFTLSQRETQYLFTDHDLPPPAADFMRNTLASIGTPLAVRAAVFFYGREEIIPQMFLAMVNRLPEGGSAPLLIDYLKRHITTDHEVHGPMAQRLLEHLFMETDQKNLLLLAQEHVEKALEARIALWNGICEILPA